MYTTEPTYEERMRILREMFLKAMEETQPFELVTYHTLPYRERVDEPFKWEGM